MYVINLRLGRPGAGSDKFVVELTGDGGYSGKVYFSLRVLRFRVSGRVREYIFDRNGLNIVGPLFEGIAKFIAVGTEPKRNS